MAAPTVLLDLPDELISAVLIEVREVATIVRCTRVCKRFQRLVDDDSLWRGLYLSMPGAQPLPAHSEMTYRQAMMCRPVEPTFTQRRNPEKAEMITPLHYTTNNGSWNMMIADEPLDCSGGGVIAFSYLLLRHTNTSVTFQFGVALEQARHPNVLSDILPPPSYDRYVDAHFARAAFVGMNESRGVHYCDLAHRSLLERSDALNDSLLSPEQRAAAEEAAPPSGAVRSGSVVTALIDMRRAHGPAICVYFVLEDEVVPRETPGATYDVAARPPRFDAAAHPPRFALEYELPHDTSVVRPYFHQSGEGLHTFVVSNRRGSYVPWAQWIDRLRDFELPPPAEGARNDGDDF